MANNVYSKIILQDANIDAEKAFVEVFNYLEDNGEKGLEYSHILPETEIMDNSYYDENIGPRFANITKYMGTEVEITSGWMSPHIFFEILGEHLSSYDPDVKLTMQYVDEYYVFAGVYTWFDGMQQKEESGGWFREQHEELGGNPSDLPDFIYDTIDEWVEDEIRL